MGSADPQPGLGFLVKLSNRQCRHAVNAITASYGCKAAYEEPIHPCFQGRFASQPLHVARLSFRQQPANVMVDLTSLPRHFRQGRAAPVHSAPGEGQRPKRGDTGHGSSFYHVVNLLRCRRVCPSAPPVGCATMEIHGKPPHCTKPPGNGVGSRARDIGVHLGVLG